MKKLVMGFGALLFAVSLSVAAPKARNFTGEIMDSQCAATGSHASMLKMSGMGDKDPNDPMAKKMCTQKCVQMGGKYVLYDAAEKAVYQLDDQDKAKEFAGQKVKVTGTYDEASKTIHITTIETAS
ncbi:MAG TPA: DUF5818 domain-containing protein [Terriglobia bacterium]|nr:DUF5818 domain-containing protein [Terriglobia bacterium]